MVIFVCGVITGGIVTHEWKAPVLVQPVPAASTTNSRAWPMAAGFQRPEFLRRMDRQLNLSPQQHDDIARIIRESHQRTQVIWTAVQPQMTEELKRVREEIRLVLTPEQRKRWTELMSKRRKNENASANPPPLRSAQPEMSGTLTNAGPASPP